jgi:hypothetical protein
MGALFSFVLLTVLEFLIPDRVVNVAFVFVVSVLLVGLVLVAYGTMVRNGWGINIRQVNCPHCNTPVPKARKPKSRREMLWGGSSCDKCGCQMDKWGNQLTS